MKQLVGLALSAIMGGLLLIFASSAAHAQTPVPGDPSIAAQATEPAPTTLTIVGHITNGTSGGSLPFTTTVALYAVDGQSLAFTNQSTADASGTVHFENVAYKAGRGYGLATVLGAVQYHSDLVSPKDGEKTLTIPFQIYDTTTDTNRLRVDQMYVVGQFPSDKELQIINAYIISNNGDRTVEGGEKTADGQPAALRFYLPKGAKDIEFQGDDGKRFTRVEDGFLTTWGVPPGNNAAQVVVRYTVPYSGQLHLETKVQYLVQKVNVLLADQGMTLTSAALVDQGVQTGQDGVARRAYIGDGIAPGASLIFDVTGTPKLSSPAQPSVPPGASSVTVVPAGKQAEKRLPGEIVVAVGLLVILAACTWRIIALRSRPEDALGEHRALFEAIADLDEEHEAGKIGDADYSEQRSFLKAALLAALQNPIEAIENSAEGQA